MKSQSSMATKGNRLRVKKALSIGTVSYGILNCGVGEDSRESLGQQGDQTKRA